MATEHIYISHDNIVSVELTEDGINLSQAAYNSIIRMTLDFNGVIVDSSIVGSGAGEPFDWTGDRKLDLALGLLDPAIASGTYTRVKHVVYSLDNSRGVVWGFLSVLVA